MAENPSEYHLAELALARSGTGQRGLLPVVPPGCCAVLDIGCGAGQTLLTCAAGVPLAVGVDFDLDALRLSRSLQVPAIFASASGEQLPFPSGSFDFVYSRVALPYMRISSAAAEMSRVLRPGGRIWLSLHPLGMLSLRAALSHPRKALFEIYRLINTAALHFGASQFRYPLRRSRMESYQTPGGMRRILTANGFDNIEIRHETTHFVVTAARKA